MRVLSTILCLLLGSYPAAAQRQATPPAAYLADTEAIDPLTAEPLIASPVYPAHQGTASRNDGELRLLQVLGEGSTRLVRFADGPVFDERGLTALMHNGSDLTLYDLNGAVQEAPERSPVELDRFALDALPTDAVLVNDTAYVALRKNRGLLVLDLVGGEIAEVGRLEGDDLLAIDVAGGYAYAGAGESGLVVYDVSDPASPQRVADIDTPGSANGVAIRDALLFVADGAVTDGPNLRIYDLADPAAPALIGTVEIEGFATHVHAPEDDNDVVFWGGDFGLVTLDVRDPTESVVFDTDSLGGATVFEVNRIPGTFFVLAAGLTGVSLVRAVPPSYVLERVSALPADQALSVDASTRFPFALVADRFEGASLALVRDPFDPVFLPDLTVPSGGFAYKAFFDGGQLYVTDLTGGLRIFDTFQVFSEEPGAFEVARIDLPVNTQEVTARDGRAYVTDAAGPTSGLTILDVNDPATPTVAGTYASDNPMYGLHLDGTTLFVANGPGGVVALDVSDPENVVEVGRVALASNTVDVVVDVWRAVAFVANQGKGMVSLDVSDPTAMTILDTEPSIGVLNAVDLASPSEFFLRSGFFVADEAAGLLGVRAIDPADLALAYEVATRSAARDVSSGEILFGDAVDGLQYIASDAFGLEVFYLGELYASFETTDRGLGVTRRCRDPETDPEFCSANVVAIAAGGAGVYLFEAPFFVADETTTSARTTALDAVWPNPVRETITARFAVRRPGPATLAVYDLLGRHIVTVADGLHSSGTHTVSLGTHGLPSGTYVLRLRADGKTSARTFTILSSAP
ncbi:MAG: T9SS type A sorting domain-containing protein [Bacteroidota bacterium]